MGHYDKHLQEIEERLLAIERVLRLRTPPFSPPPPPTEAAGVPKPSPSPPLPSPGWSIATTILGWGGVAALVLATTYLIRLAIDAGWLTPARQVGIAGLFGLVLIDAGFILAAKYPRYASLLPACGVVVLFITNYGAHLYHRLIGPLPATVGVIAICTGALALGWVFEGDFYALFAVIGSYTGPLLLSHLRADPTDLIIYFSAWSLLFCWYAIRSRKRQVYLLAGYLSFIVFDALWRMGGASDWMTAVIFQFVQLTIFAGATAVYSIRNKSPMGQPMALVHLPVLLLFYFVQYTAVKQHLPDWAPWLAFCSMGLLLGAYAIARAFLTISTPGGQLVVTIYAAIVLLHAGYLELITDRWRPWVGLVSVTAMGAYAISRYQQLRKWWPLFATAGIIFLLNYGRLVIGWELTDIPGYKFLIPLYAIVLYIGYWLAQGRPDLVHFQKVLLVMGHINTMAGAVQLFDNRIAISLVWGMLAVASLIVATISGNKLLGRSALFVFAASAVKVSLFDLSGAAPLVRIGCLVILGVTLYIGGLLYQKMDEPEKSSSPQPVRP